MALLMGGIAMTTAVLLVSSRLITGTGNKDTRMRQQGLVSSTHALKIQQAQSDAVLDMIRAEIAGSAALKNCFAEIGSTGCASLGSEKDLEIPAALIFSDECTGLRGPCTPSDRVMQTKMTYNYECDATSCKGAKVKIKSDLLVATASMKESKVSWIEIPGSRIDERVKFNFACSSGGEFLTSISIKESLGKCGGVAANACAPSSPPSLLNVFGDPDTRSANVCNTAPSLTFANRQGYRSVHVYDYEMSRALCSGASCPIDPVITPGPKGDYCSGELYNTTTVGNAVDDSQSGNSEASFEAGKPFPCTIKNHFHLNLGPKTSGSVTNYCPSNYTSTFVRMSGTSYFSCSTSDTSVSCTNTDEDEGFDMDTILFECSWIR